MSETRAMLDKMTTEAMKEAVSALVRTQRADPVVLFMGPDNRMGRVMVPDFLSAMMNSGPAKNFLFGFFRSLAEKVEARAVCIATECWYAELNAKGLKTPKADLDRIMSIGLEEAHEQGLCNRFEAIAIVAQSPDLVLLTTQPFERGADSAITLGKRSTKELAQAEFGGRMKMYGEDMAPPFDGMVN